MNKLFPNTSEAVRIRAETDGRGTLEKLRVPFRFGSAEGARPPGRISQAKGQSVLPRKACISVFEALKNQRCSFFGKH